MAWKYVRFLPREGCRAAAAGLRGRSAAGLGEGVPLGEVRGAVRVLEGPNVHQLSQPSVRRSNPEDDADNYPVWLCSLQRGWG